MAHKPKVLCVLPYVPVPAETGGTQRTLALMAALAREFAVTVLALRSPGTNPAAFRDMLSCSLQVVDPGAIWRLAGEPRALLSGAPFRYCRYATPPVRRALEQLLAEQSFDAVHFDHPHMAQLIPTVRRIQPSARIVIDEHNVEGHVVQGFASVVNWPRSTLLRRQAARVLALERRLVREADLTVACSEGNAEALRQLGARRVVVVPNGIRVDPDAQGPWRGRRRVIFVGSLDWPPNADAALRLLTKIWPRIRNALAGSELAIVGRHPPPEVVKNASAGVLITGRVASVAPYLRSARATAIPLRAGSGTRIKILEAWAAGVPVVANRLAVDGLTYADEQNVLIAETEEEFAAGITRVWSDPALAARLAAHGARTAVHYEQSRTTQRLVHFYSAMLDRARAYTVRAYESASLPTE